MYMDQFISYNKKANIIMRNIFPLTYIPKGVFIYNFKKHVMNRG